MADNKTLQTRISLKIDTWANWSKIDTAKQGGNLVLKRGEVAFVQIDKDVPPIDNNGSTATALLTNPNTVLFKVGDGKTAFKDLKWGSALAADVHDWAKKSEAEFKTYVDGIIANAVKNGDIDLEGYATDAELSALDTTLRALISGNGTNITNLQNRVKAIEDDYTTTSEATSIAATKANAVLGTSGDTATANTVYGAKAAAAAAQTKAEANATAIEGINTTISNLGNTYATDAELNTVKNTLQGNIDKKANSADVYTSTAADAKFATITTVNGLTSRVAANETAIGTINETLEGLDAKFIDTTELASAKSELNTAIGKKVDQTAYDNKIGALEDADEALDGRLDTAETKIEALEQASGTHATTTQLNNAKAALIGTANDESTADTIKGAKKYTDEKVAALVNGAPEALDTLDELAAALRDNKDIVSVIEQSIGTKADKTALDAVDSRVEALEEIDHSHSNKNVLDGITATKVSNWDSAATNNHTHSNKTVLDGITSAKVSTWDGYATGKADKTALDATNTRVKTIEDDYLKEADYFYIDCGSSVSNIN